MVCPQIVQLFWYFSLVISTSVSYAWIALGVPQYIYLCVPLKWLWGGAGKWRCEWNMEMISSKQPINSLSVLGYEKLPWVVNRAWNSRARSYWVTEVPEVDLGKVCCCFLLVLQEYHIPAFLGFAQPGWWHKQVWCACLIRAVLATCTIGNSTHTDFTTAKLHKVDWAH